MLRRVLPVLPLLAALLLAAPGVAKEAPRKDNPLEAALRAHIDTLASDAFEGREPGTAGESLTLRYLAREWFKIGLVSGTNDPGNAWFAPVELIEREPARSLAGFQRNRRALPLPADGVLALTSGSRQLLENAPLLFVGHALGDPPARAELAGRIAVLLDSVPAGTEAALADGRQDKLLDAGASAVLTLLDAERTIESIRARRGRAGYALAGDALGGDLEAFASADYATRLLGAEYAPLRTAASAPGFIPRVLPLTGTLEATTRETRISTHNLIGRLPGRLPGRGAVLVSAHWDHFGICAEPPAEDLICNGAIDNASGLAVMTEIARGLAKGKKLDRDVYFLATTAEEIGLLGAHAFAENPPLPLEGIVAAFNIDSPALAPRGRPFTIIGHGLTPLDGEIGRVAKREKRRMEQSSAAETFLRRQDGWALLQHDIPAVMVSSSYSDAGMVERFMEDTYHRPGDQSGPALQLGGAADDVAFHLALVRWFGTVKNWSGRGGAVKAR